MGCNDSPVTDSTLSRSIKGRNFPNFQFIVSQMLANEYCRCRLYYPTLKGSPVVLLPDSSADYGDVYLVVKTTSHTLTMKERQQHEEQANKHKTHSQVKR